METLEGNQGKDYHAWADTCSNSGRLKKMEADTEMLRGENKVVNLGGSSGMATRVWTYEMPLVTLRDSQSP